MDLLILGGTVFLGRHLAEEALRRGHRLTLLNRGRQGSGLFPAVERIEGDRKGSLGALRGRRWDAVIDTSGYTPGEVSAAARALAGSVDLYTFTSTVSVYRDFSTAGMDETAPVCTLTAEELREAERLDRENPAERPRFGELYGGMKAEAEKVLEAALPGRALVIRPGLIVGPHDPTDRFTYWPSRFATGGAVLVPGRAEREIQFIDGRDLAAWMLTVTEEGRTGVFNATGPESPLTMGRLVAACLREAPEGTRPVWVRERDLLEAGVKPWTELPLWIPVDEDPSMVGLERIDCRRAFAAGLAARPLDETVRDTLAWDRARPAGAERRAGLDRAREAELLRRFDSAPAGP